MKITKEILDKAEEKGLVNSSNELWNFIKQEKKPKISILSILGVILILFGIFLTALMLFEVEYYKLSGLIVASAIGLIYYSVKNLKKSELIFKIAEVFIWLIFTISLFVFFFDFVEYHADKDNLFLALKVIELPSLILSLYLYFKNKNEYLLAIPFAIITWMIHYVLYQNVIEFPRRGMIMEKNLTVLFFLDLLIITLLSKYKLLKSSENVASSLFLIAFNFQALLYLEGKYFIINTIQGELLVYTIVGLNLLFGLFNSLNKNYYYNKIIYLFVLIWLFTFNNFESIEFVIFNIIALSTGFYMKNLNLIKISMVILLISLEQIANLSDIAQVLYYFGLGIGILTINHKYHDKLKEI